MSRLRAQRAGGAAATTALAVAAAMVPALPAGASPTATGTTGGAVTVVADGLFSPRGITVGGNGEIHIAEAGVGGPNAVQAHPGTPREVTLCVGRTGAVATLTHGRLQRSVTGLVSYAGAAPDGSCDAAAIGDFAAGPQDVVAGHGVFDIVIGLGTEASNRDRVAEGAAEAAGLGTLKRVFRGGGERTVADLAAYEGEADPDRQGLGSNPASLVVRRDRTTVVADAQANTLLQVDRRGRVSTIAVLPTRDEPMPEVSCGLPPSFPPVGTPMPTKAVPSSVVLGPDGAYYIGRQTGFPGTPGASSVVRVDPRTGAVSDYATGFNGIGDIAFGPDGALYVLETARHGLIEARLCGRLEGRLSRVAGGVTREIPVPGLIAPGGVAVARDGTVYVTNRSNERGGVGQVLRVRPRR
jgi:glucose/arabinose dehydrogenase